MTAQEKIKMFRSVDAKDLAASHGMEVHPSPLVDVSDEKKIKAFDLSEVRSFQKSNGTVTVNIHVLYDGKNEPVAAFSPENPNVATAPLHKVLAGL